MNLLFFPSNLPTVQPQKTNQTQRKKEGNTNLKVLKLVKLKNKQMKMQEKIKEIKSQFFGKAQMKWMNSYQWQRQRKRERREIEHKITNELVMKQEISLQIPIDFKKIKGIL